MMVVRLVQRCNLMAFFVTKSLDYVESNDNEKYCYTVAASSPHSTAVIFLSQKDHIYSG